MHHKTKEKMWNIFTIADLMKNSRIRYTVGDIAGLTGLSRRTVVKHLSLLVNKHNVVKYTVHEMSGGVGYKYLYERTPLLPPFTRNLARELGVEYHA